MQLVGFGIRLIRVRESDIELIRQHRNSELIRSKMQFREEITPEQQKGWFRKINTLAHNYFLIEIEHKFIGVINGSGIDWDKKITKSGGIFVWDKAFWGTKITAAAAILLTDISIAMGFEKTYAEILDSNAAAIAFNTLLGYEKISEANLHGASEYVLTRESYLRERPKAVGTLLPEYQDEIPLVILEPARFELEKYYIEPCQSAVEAGRIKLNIQNA